MSTQEPATWQELLGQLITNPQEKTRLARALRIRPITLQRWIDGISRPREENIRQLIRSIPRDIYPLFMHLLIADFPELRRDELPAERLLQNPPAEFYARALSNLALTPISIYRQSMQDLVLRQALQHLDPDQRGLAISIVVCVPPRNGRKVRSLREMGGLATPPWPRNVAEKSMLLGAESLIGHAISHARPCMINSRDEETYFPVQWTEHERSVVALPILRHGRIVGGMIVASAHEFFFTTPYLAVIENYAHLAACIFEPGEAFDLHQIQLGLMPSYADQQPYFADYHERVSQKLLEADARGEQLAFQQAHELVWQDLEDILLRVALRTQ